MGKDHGQGRSDAGLTGQRANVQYSTVRYSTVMGNGQWAMGSLAVPAYRLA
jgi:hypothetical protein